jgi:branched-subunit amino acid transport protein AzlD
MGPHGLLRRYLYFLCVRDVRTSQKTHGLPLPVTYIALVFICCRYSFLTGNTSMSPHGLLCIYLYFLCVRDVRTSQKTHGLPLSVIYTALVFICRWYSFLTGNTSMGPHGLLRRYLYFVCVRDVRTSQKTQGLPLPVTYIALVFICRWYSFLTGNTSMGSHGLLRG